MCSSISSDDAMDLEPDENLSTAIVPEHLGNEDTMIKLGFIDELKKLFAINELLNLPQLVVIGDQSSGKSSVLQAITRLSFPVDDGLCTRFPTEVSLQRASEDALEISITKPVRALDAPNQSPAQKKWLEKQSTRIEEFNGKWGGKVTQMDDFCDIITEAKRVIMGDSVEPGQSAKKVNVAQNKKNLLSDATLKIVKKGPGEINITIIDIPGLVSSTHPAHKMARSLVDHYITNPRSIVLAVAHPANVETQDMFQIIKDIENWKNRVIGVITKCDKIEPEGDDWVFRAIKNDEGDPEFDRCLKYGWFALRNLSPSERKSSPSKKIQTIRDQKEEKLFSQKVWTDLERQEKLGIKNLKVALTQMHNEHVTRSIPELIPEIADRLKSVERRIEALGPPRITPESQLNCLVNLATKYSLHAGDAIDGHNDRLPVNSPEVKIRKIVRDTLDEFRDGMTEVYDQRFNSKVLGFSLESVDERTWERAVLRNKYFNEISRCIEANRGKEMADEVNGAVIRSLWSEITPVWRDQTKALIESLVNAIWISVGCLLHAICEEESLLVNVQNLLEEDKTAVHDDAMHELDKLLNDEKSGLIVTLNKWNVYQLSDMREGRFKLMTARLDEIQRRDKDIVKTQVKSWFGHNAKIDAIFMTHDKLASYYQIGMVRFVDNVCHQVCERHLLGGKSPLRTLGPDMITKKIQGDEEALRKIAGETAPQLAERARLQKDQESLKRAMEKAKQYKLTLGVHGMGL
ncbi:hypothetical protein BCON_0286g00060 [Botryotinia convoluta]|uniref:GED domain-containing protein n=1 Tax=Botryotinia convoluta TaxID=54673 RepID=A0A4Z1HQJ6_9HELO|nr:hypothetical protein BCON_0286g00060 [Botryotinia convoluta]